MTAAATQLDLFGAVLSAERQRRVDALTCLRDAMPNALEIVVALRREQSEDTRAPHANGDWAYCASRAGLRVEARDVWSSGGLGGGERRGWSRTPAHLTTWDELTELIGHDPRRAEVAAWVDSLPPLRWKVVMRPHELWPDPDGWHIGYLCHDHVNEHWTARRRAWRLVLDLLGDAIRVGST